MNLKIAILGDSISQGIGKKKYNYVNSLKCCLKRNGVDANIKNFALTGTMISYAIDIVAKIKQFKPDCVLILYGNVEAIIRPDLRRKTFITRVIPRRYKKIFMLDPRPFYSKSRIKRFGQRLDNAYRFIMRRVISKLNGTYRLMEPEEFRKNYVMLLKEMKEINACILCCSNVRVDETLFPGTSNSLREFCKVIQEVASENQVEYIPFNEWQKQYPWEEIYSHDHFHPNQRGYRLIGAYFSAFILRYIEKIRKNNTENMECD